MAVYGRAVTFGTARRGRSPPRPLLAVQQTAHPSTASVPITALLYNDPLLCVVNMVIKGLTSKRLTTNRMLNVYNVHVDFESMS